MKRSFKFISPRLCFKHSNKGDSESQCLNARVFIRRRKRKGEQLSEVGEKKCSMLLKGKKLSHSDMFNLGCKY